MAFKIKILSIFIVARVITLGALAIGIPVVGALAIGAAAFAQDDNAGEFLSDTGRPPPKKKSTNSKRKKDSGQSARVKIDGAAIYEGPSFDSPVLEYMDTDKKVLISKKLFTGVGGMGAFYKIKLRPNVFGYITDTDVEIKKHDGDKDSDMGMGGDSEGDKREEDPTVLRDFKASEADEPAFTNSIYMTRYLGLVYGTYNYSEVLRRTVEVDQVQMIGAKLTGPTGLMGGMPMDLGLVLTTSAPGFYSEIASSTKGYMLIGDGLLMMPLYESSSVMTFFGLGLMMRYSSWQVKLSNPAGKPAIDSQEIGFGAAAEVGAAMRLGHKFIFRLDGKYYYEKEKYFGYDLALQYKF